MKLLSSPDRIAFADLVEKAFDADFDEAFPENGKFEKQSRRGREYWYYRGYERSSSDKKGRQTLKYVGPIDDPEITKRVERFGRVRTSYRQRRELASRLRQAGLPSPFQIEGEVTSALAKAGLFRLRAPLIGSIAFQTYGGMLGVKLAEAHYRTDDLDVAQFYGLAIYLDDKLPDIEGILKAVDNSFVPIFNPTHPNVVLGYRNALGFKVEFLTPNRGDEKLEQTVVKLPALGNVGAQVLRYLDFLIRNPVRSVMLHDAGVGVLVPAPARYAIHKLIVATLRGSNGEDPSKAIKDIEQSTSLIEALTQVKQSTDLGMAWIEAWERGPSWKRRLATGALRLGDDAFTKLSEAVAVAARLNGNIPDEFAITQGRDGMISWIADRFPQSQALSNK